MYIYIYIYIYIYTIHCIHNTYNMCRSYSIEAAIICKLPARPLQNAGRRGWHVQWWPPAPAAGVNPPAYVHVYVYVYECVYIYIYYNRDSGYFTVLYNCMNQIAGALAMYLTCIYTYVQRCVWPPAPAAGATALSPMRGRSPSSSVGCATSPRAPGMYVCMHIRMYGGM